MTTVTITAGNSVGEIVVFVDFSDGEPALIVNLSPFLHIQKG